ncbi:MAG: DNA photolyase family protein [Gammaproteobacteria bacterium]|nr:DNA photolyase family protein [Gammaproteobacteria bacterium]
MSTSLLWFRRDLRLDDQPALDAALARGSRVVPVYVESGAGRWAEGAASRWWRHHSLAALSEALAERGSRLLLRRGDPQTVMATLVRETGAVEIHTNRLAEPPGCAGADSDQLAGVPVRLHGGNLLNPPELPRNRSGGPYRVFTPYYQRVLGELNPAPRPAPTALPAVPGDLDSLRLDQLGLLPRQDWARGLAARWTPGESGAQARLERVVDSILAAYPEGRDRPAEDATSCLSPHLHFGEISPARVMLELQAAVMAQRDTRQAAGARELVRQLIWREFAHHVLLHFPHTCEQPFDPRFGQFPWREDPVTLAAWQRGETGIPMVDAGMRELWHTGFMHNRVRMIAASLLTKSAGIHWLHGARWFWDTLVDADLASNSLNWQWVAGCGVDAAPFFRIFNPVTQSRRFDPAGVYLRRWLPELSPLPNALIHAPWEKPALVQDRGVVLGRDYPRPVLDLAVSRNRALAAWKRLLQKA